MRNRKDGKIQEKKLNKEWSGVGNREEVYDKEEDKNNNNNNNNIEIEREQNFGGAKK